MKKMKRIKMLTNAATAFIVLGISFSVNAVPSKAYPGKFKSKVTNVEAANIVSLLANVWTGYPRVFRITLPGISVPVSSPNAPACQNDMAQKALEITNNFLKDAEYIEVRDIYMENTGVQDGLSNIFTNKGNLVDKLKAEGLARPESVKATTPWC